MTLSENLFAALAGKPHDDIPFFADLSWHYAAMEAQNRLDVRYQGPDGYLRYHTDLGVGVCFYAPFLWQTEYTDVKVTVKESNGRRTMTYTTTKGELRQIDDYIPGANTYGIREHFIKNIEDLRIMTYIAEDARHTANFAPYLETAALWEDRGVAVAMAPVCVSPLQSMLTRWAGVESTYEILADDGDEAMELFKRISTADDPIYKILADSPAGYIEFPENLSSEITGVYNFKKYNAPIYKERIDLLQKAGKYVGIHIDGTLRGCLELLAECGFDAAESVTPAPTGDISLDALRTKAGDIVIWGGIPGALFSPLFVEDVFKKHIDDIIHNFGQDTRFVLGVADQVPPDGLLSRVAYAAKKINSG